MNRSKIRELLRELKSNGMDIPEHLLRDAIQEVGEQQQQDKHDSKPAPDTVVWWRWNAGSRWQLGLVEKLGRGVTTGEGYIYRWDSIQYKPARVCAEDEVPVPLHALKEVQRLACIQAAASPYSQKSDTALNIVHRIILDAEKMEKE